MDGIKSIKKIKSVQQTGIAHEDDLMGRPTVRVKPVATEPQPAEFVGNQIFLNGKEVGKLIRDTVNNNPHDLAKIASALEAFKEFCLKRRKKRSFLGRKKDRTYSDDELSTIFAMCDTYITKVGEFIKQRFEAAQDGLSLIFDEDGQLVLNGMNIHTYVERCREFPNDKSLLFLRGIRKRLELVLENKASSRNYERIHGVIVSLFVEIDAILNG